MTTSLPKRITISPLRYPGGKAALYDRLRSITRSNNIEGGTYVEPYAGGAGAALALLITGEVRNIVINDLDPAVYAFWRAILDYPQEFSGLIAKVDLSVDEWKIQKGIYTSVDRDDYLKLGFATFYLNRTNRSGVLNGGPIGGLDQSGNYKIDARFNRAALQERLRLINVYAKRISVSNDNGLEVIRRYARRKNTFIYADPPYFEKAGSLYMNSFQMIDHVELANCLNRLTRSKWILTYDNSPHVVKLYPKRRREIFSLGYSAHRVIKANEIMVYSDAMAIPIDSQSFNQESIELTEITSRL